MPRPPKDARTEKRVRLTLVVPDDLAAEVRGAVMALAGPPEHLTLAGLVENALRRELDRLQKKHGGDPFPRRRGKLRPGRPVGS